MTPVERVLSALERVKPAGKGKWTALCPAHADKNPSLSVAEGGDGHVLLYCHVGCEHTAIVSAIGIEVRHLFPEGAASRCGRGREAQTTTFTRQEGIERLRKGVRRRDGSNYELVNQFEYDVVDGGKLLALRFENGKGEKTFRQMSSADRESWMLKGPDRPLLPYMHERLQDATRVVIAEGELCVHELVELGIQATTSAGGSKAAHKTSWGGLDSTQLVLIPDNDDAGRKYMRDVRALCNPSSSIIVELPGLGEGEDVVDFIARRKAEGRTKAEIREEILSLIAAHATDQEDSPALREPFPLHVLPPVVAGYARLVAEARPVGITAPPPSALAAMAPATGLARVAWDEYAAWEEIPVFWVALVSRSGTRKSILIDDFFGPHLERQRKLFEEFAAAKADYQRDLDAWNRRQKNGDSEDAEPRPTPPVLEHVYTSDTTQEGLVDTLATSPRGVAVIVDELTTFFGGMGRYAGAADADRGFYLSLFRGVQFKKDRASKEPRLIDKASASIFGTVQPKVLKKRFDDEAFASGLASRFLLLYPRPQVKRYTRGPSSREKDAYFEFVEALFNLQMQPYMGAAGAIRTGPQQVGFTDHARDLLGEFVPDWSAEGLTSSANVEAAMSKLEGYSIRFALVLRVCREIDGAASPEDPITREDLQNGIRLARWFRDEAVRVYAELARADDEEPQEVLLSRVAVIRERFGGAVTVREWRKLNTRKTTDEAKHELDELVEARLATTRPRPSGPRGGKPTIEYALVEPDPDGSQEEVAGWGLRVAEGESAGADQAKNPTEEAENGGRDLGSPRGRTPEPLDGLAIPAIGHHPGDAMEDVLGEQTRAPRNPQPDTPSDTPEGGVSGVEAGTAQPGTPDLFATLLEMFDGVEVEPDESVVSFAQLHREGVRWGLRDGEGVGPNADVIPTRIKRRECYRCGERRRWRIPGGQWTCPRCHPPTRTNIEWDEHEEVTRG